MKNLLIPAAVLAFTVCSAQAQEYQSQTTTRSPGCDITTYEDGSTTTRYYHVNPNTGVLDYENYVRTHASPADTPIPVTAAMNHSHATQARTEPTAVVIVKRQITVTEGPITPAQAKAAAVQLTTDQASYRTNVKSGKWHEFKNGE
jgi:hypothetical protein